MATFNEHGLCEEFDYAGRGLVAPAWSARDRRHADRGAAVGEASAGGAVSSLVGTLQKRSGASVGTLQALGLWRQMGDARVRAHVTGLYLRQNRVNRELVAYVDAGVWLTEFTMLAPGYLAEWNVLCDRAGLDMRAQKLTFRLGKAARDAGETSSFGHGGPAPSGERPPAPLTLEEEAVLARRAAVIEDDALRAKALAAMRSHAMWKKANPDPQTAPQASATSPSKPLEGSNSL